MRSIISLMRRVAARRTSGAWRGFLAAGGGSSHRISQYMMAIIRCQARPSPSFSITRSDAPQEIGAPEDSQSGDGSGAPAARTSRQVSATALPTDAPLTGGPPGDILLRSYGTDRLCASRRPPRRHLRGAGRPDAPGDPGAARVGRGVGEPARGAVRDQPARD